MNRRPIYHEQSTSFRVVSKPNGLFAAQRRTIEAKGTREADPWQDLQSPVSLEKAKERMYLASPLVKP